MQDDDQEATQEARQRLEAVHRLVSIQQQKILFINVPQIDLQRWKGTQFALSHSPYSPLFDHSTYVGGPVYMEELFSLSACTQYKQSLTLCRLTRALPGIHPYSLHCKKG